MMVHKTMWFNLIAGMKFKKHQTQLFSGIGPFAQCKLCDKYFIFNLFMKYRHSKIHFVSSDAPLDKSIEGVRCFSLCYKFGSKVHVY